jgi:hypothetical protein
MVGKKEGKGTDELKVIADCLLSLILLWRVKGWGSLVV